MINTTQLILLKLSPCFKLMKITNLFYEIILIIVSCRYLTTVALNKSTGRRSTLVVSLAQCLQTYSYANLI